MNGEMYRFVDFLQVLKSVLSLFASETDFGVIMCNNVKLVTRIIYELIQLHIRASDSLPGFRFCNSDDSMIRVYLGSFGNIFHGQRRDGHANSEAGCIFSKSYQSLRKSY